MPRIRVIKKPEDAKGIPEDQPVQIDLEAIGIVEAEEKATKEEKERQERLAKGKVQEILPGDTNIEVTTKDDSDEATVTLKQQLEDLKKANDDFRKQVDEANRRNQTLLDEARKHSSDAITAAERAQRSDLDAINNAIAAAEGEIASSQQIIEAADADTENRKTPTEAIRRLTVAQTRLIQLEDGKAALEAQIEWVKKNPQKQQSATPATLNEYIDQMPALNQAQKSWLKDHPEYMQDQTKNTLLSAAHIQSQQKNLVAGSPKYFRFIEEALGLRESEDEEMEDSKPQNISAPPSREPPRSDGNRAPNRITLTPAQREAARASGISDVDYARNLLKLGQMKREGYYGDH